MNSQLPPSCDKKRKRGNINASTLKKSKPQRFDPNLFISNNVIADALQISESDIEESDSLQDKKLMDLLYDADDEIEIELVPEVESTDEISESEWEVSDLFPRDDSCDEWHP